MRILVTKRKQLLAAPEGALSFHEAAIQAMLCPFMAILAAFSSLHPAGRYSITIPKTQLLER
jgi:hypothetical protein